MSESRCLPTHGIIGSCADCLCFEGGALHLRSRAATRTVHRAGLHCWQTLWFVFVGASARAHIGVCYIYMNLDWKRQSKCWNLQCMIKRTKHTSHSPHRRSRPHTLGTHTLYTSILSLRHRTEPAEQGRALYCTYSYFVPVACMHRHMLNEH